MSLTIELSDEEQKKIENTRYGFMDLTSSTTLFAAYDRAIEADNNRTSVDSLFEDKEYELDHINKLEPLWDSCFNKGESIILASKGGVGKSLLSIEIAKSPKITKALFLTIEDYSRNQLPRYLKNIDPARIEIMGYTKWRQYYNRIKAALVDKVNFQVLIEGMVPITYQHLINRRNVLLKQYGIKEESFLDNLLVFDMLMQNVENMGFDFICIDSLNAFFGHPSRITRPSMERLIAFQSSKRITLLLIHHINKKGEISGSSDIVNAVDSAYILSLENQGDGEESILILDEIKARHKSPKETLKIKRTKKGPLQFSHEVIERTPLKVTSDENNSLTEHLRSIIDTLSESEGDLDFKDLEKEMKDKSFSCGNSIKNGLKKLAEMGFVEKSDRKTWNKIHLLKDDMDDDIVSPV